MFCGQKTYKMYSCDYNYCKNVRCDICIDGCSPLYAWDHCCQRCIEFHCEECGEYHILADVHDDRLRCSMMFPWASIPVFSEEHWNELERLGGGIGIHSKAEEDSDLEYDSDYDSGMSNLSDWYYWTD